MVLSWYIHCLRNVLNVYADAFLPRRRHIGQTSIIWAAKLRWLLLQLVTCPVSLVVPQILCGMCLRIQPTSFNSTSLTLSLLEPILLRLPAQARAVHQCCMHPMATHRVLQRRHRREVPDIYRRWNGICGTLAVQAAR